MTVTLFITIDTEEDQWGEYKANGFTVKNVQRIPIIQDIFDSFGAVPTYLVNYPVVSDEHAKNTLLDILERGRCEIGTHCHPWNTPPFGEGSVYEDSMLCNLPYQNVFKKMVTLHEAIKTGFGKIPISFRAGRWGFGTNVAQCIYELGYKVDTSVISFTDWTYLGGPDFRDATPFPYRFNPANVMAATEHGPLLEIPATVGFFQKNMELCNRILKLISHNSFQFSHVIGVLDKLRIVNRRILSPETSSGKEMISLAESLIKQGCPFLNMFFHSTSLLPGKSPFVRDEREFQRFLENIKVFLQFAKKRGMRVLPLHRGLEIIDG